MSSKLEVGQTWIQTRKDGSTRAVEVLAVEACKVLPCGLRNRVTLAGVGAPTPRKLSKVWEETLHRNYDGPYPPENMEEIAGAPEIAPKKAEGGSLFLSGVGGHTIVLDDAQGLEVTPKETAQMVAMSSQLLEADAAQPDDAPPLQAQLNTATLPKAIRLMVDYCKRAPVAEVLRALERQFGAVISEPAPEELEDFQRELEEGRAKLTGLVVGVALGVAVLPAEPLFPALVSADRLARLVRLERKREHRKKVRKAHSLSRHRKDRKAKRRAAKRTR